MKRNFKKMQDMKKQVLFTLLAGMMLFSCAKMEDSVPASVSAEKVQIIASLPEDAKVSYGYSAAGIKSSWETGDRILVTGHNTGVSSVFTLTSVGSDPSVAVFEGNSVADSAFDIAILAKGVSAASQTELRRRDFSHQVQTGNASLAHLGSFVWLENVSTYRAMTFTDEWAGEKGGSFHINPLVRFEVKLPTSGKPVKLGLISTKGASETGEQSKRLRHCYGGTKVNSVWLDLQSVTPESGILTAYMALPQAADAGSYALSVLMDDNKYYVKQFTTTKALAGGATSRVKINMTTGTVNNWGVNDKVPINVKGDVDQWYALRILAHPHQLTMTMPVDPLYKDLYEARVIADEGWLFGRIEFYLPGWNYSAPLDILIDLDPSATTGGYLPFGSANYEDGQHAFSDAGIDRYLEHSGLTQVAYSRFSNWTANIDDPTDPALNNRLAWYNFRSTAAAGSNVFGNLDRVYYSADVPVQLTYNYLYAAGKLYQGAKKGILEFRLRRFTLNMSRENKIKIGFKLMGPGYNGEAGWHCRGLLPQGSRNDAGIRQLVPMALLEVPAYKDYEYPYAYTEQTDATQP